MTTEQRPIGSSAWMALSTGACSRLNASVHFRCDFDIRHTSDPGQKLALNCGVNVILLDIGEQQACNYINVICNFSCSSVVRRLFEQSR